MTWARELLRHYRAYRRCGTSRRFALKFARRLAGRHVTAP